MPAEPNRSAQLPEPSRRLRVLIVDDERDTVSTLTALLADEGYQVRGVHLGRDVIPAMRDFMPDAVLLDLAMPGISGWDLAREIRSRYPDRNPVLVAISGQYKEDADKLLGQLAGFDHHVTKPCDPEELMALLAGMTPRG